MSSGKISGKGLENGRRKFRGRRFGEGVGFGSFWRYFGREKGGRKKERENDGLAGGFGEKIVEGKGKFCYSLSLPERDYIWGIRVNVQSLTLICCDLFVVRALLIAKFVIFLEFFLFYWFF